MQPDLLLTGGHVYTMDPARPRASSLAVREGRVVALDEDAAALRQPATRVIDLGGRAVLPGFVDAHVHFGSFSLAREQVDLDQAPTLEAGLDRIRRAADELTPGAWVRGRGWDRNRWGRLPAAADLDAATGDRPAALSSHDGHSVWLNSAALSYCGINDDTQPPAGGVIERDDNGHPSGVLFENAQDLVRRKIPEPTDDQLREAISRALPLAAAAGLTGIHNLEDSRSLRAFQALEQSGDLTLRVYHGIPRGKLAEARDLGLRTGVGGELVRIGPVKLFSDGALGSRTAYMLEPYENRTDGYRGVPTLDPTELAELMQTAADAELDIAVHAIGDAAVRRVLDAYESTRERCAPLRVRMLRIEHAQLTHPSDIGRFAQLGVIASMQPIHAIADWRTANEHWGARARHGYAWRELLDSGAHVAFGTDAPVERIEPLLNVHAAVTRVDADGEPAGGWHPEQRVSLEEAVRAYTSGSAYAERASHQRGTLMPGKDADLVVLAADPFELPADALRELTIDLTVVGGRIVYEGSAR
ncbi:MAG: amidohydrolase [Chloroflexi bacterium]|nr:amidohydrolase [Chloroflexota bacterium]